MDAVQLLVSAGADINYMDKSHRTPITQALYNGIVKTEIKDDYMTIVALLVSAGADINRAVIESCNPLLTSALLKSATMVKYFLSAGANPNVKCKLYRWS